jgi:transposase
MPLATEVLAGERADEGLYLPIMERVRTGWQTPGLLLVGDCKRSALDTRAYLARPPDCAVSPLPVTGATAEAMDTWITAGVTRSATGE